MAIDVDYHLFYKLSPNKLKPFAKAHTKKLKEANYNLWLNGLYMVNAIGSCFSKDSKYPKKPFDIYSEKDRKDLEMQEWERFKCNFVGKYEEQEHVE